MLQTSQKADTLSNVKQAATQIAAGTDRIFNKLQSWSDGLLDMLPNLVLSALVLIFFFVLTRLVAKYSNRLLNRMTQNAPLSRILSGILSVIVFFIGFSIALNVLQLDKAVASLLAGAGLAGLAIGFAFQDLIINFISGVIIVIKRPFTIGDLVETNSFMGNVKQMDFRSTILVEPSGKWIVLPNRNVIENPVINYSTSGKRRIDIAVGISYDENLQEVQEATIEAISTLPFLMKDSKIEFFFSEFAQSSVDYVVRFWIDFTNSQAEYLYARHEAIKVIFKTYKDKGIMIPFPIRTIYLNVDVKGEGKQVTFNLTGEAVQHLID